MFGTLVIIIGLSTLFFTAILAFMDTLSLFSLIGFVVFFNILQWLMAPYLVDLMYRVKEVSASERPELYDLIERLSQKSGIIMPRVMISNLPIPNAFAYGSPVAGTRIAVTDGLLRALEPEEVEAVVGHELGHIRHRDVQIMMFVSVLPAIFYSVGYSLYFSSRYQSRDRDRGSGLAVLGMASIFLYFVLTLLSLKLSRLREYYADKHSVAVVDDGGRKLSEALAKIVTYTARGGMYGRRGTTSMGARQFSNFKSLFIADPDTAQKDAQEIGQFGRAKSDQQLVQDILSRQPSAFDSFVEMFSTHPNIVKRLRALQEPA